MLLRFGFGLLLIVICLEIGCQPASSSRPDSVSEFYHSENLDTVIAAYSELSIKTYRDPQRMLEALRAQLGDSCIGYVSGSDTILHLHFPTDGPYHYRWYGQKIFGFQHAEVALRWNDHSLSEFSLRVYNDAGLSVSERPDIVNWLNELVKKHLTNQPFIKAPALHRKVFPHRSISELASVNWPAFQREIDRRLPDGPRMFGVSILVNEQGKGSIDRYYGPDTLRAFLGQWVDSLHFPVLIFKEMRDTGTYVIDFDKEVTIDDSVAIAEAQQLYRDGKLNWLDEQTQPYQLFLNRYCVVLHKAVFRSPFPLLGVFVNEKGYFFLVEPDRFTPAGSPRVMNIERSCLQDFDFDGMPELQMESDPPNMNGNRWSDLLRWNPTTQMMENVGNFSTDMKADKTRRQWLESYEGSWYMAQHKLLYGWSQHRLTSIRMVEVSLREGDVIPNNCCIVSFYDNPVFSQGIDSLRLVQDTFISFPKDMLYEAILNQNLDWLHSHQVE